MKPTVYVETSVIGHLAAWPSRDVIVAGHQQSTRIWWEDHRERFELFVSQVVLRESQAGDKQAACDRSTYLSEISVLEILQIDLDLAEQLILAGALPEKAADDALHVAIAASNQVNYLLTWNLKHINNPATKPLIEKVLRESGYHPPVICTPEELLEV